MIEYNMNVIHEWEEVGGVLGYDTDREGKANLYIMDDGEFHDRFLESESKDEDGFAKIICESALRNAGICEEEIGLLMDWDADKMSNIMED